MFRTALTLAAAALALFHVWLFAGHAMEGQLAEPGLLFRWAVAVGLAVGWAGWRHSGRVHFSGRKAVAVWVLALLLHAPALAGRIEAFSAPPPAVAATLAQVAASVAAMGGSLLLVFAAARRRIVVRPLLIHDVAPPGTATARSTDLRCLVAPRPPPLA